MKIVAVTSCATGIAHTYMAAEALERAAKAAGHEIWVETQGAGGLKPIPADIIAAADVCIFQPPPEALQIGQKQLDICIERYQECQRTNHWPGYGSGLLDVEVSYFDRRKYLN